MRLNLVAVKSYNVLGVTLNKIKEFFDVYVINAVVSVKIFIVFYALKNATSDERFFFCNK